VDVTTEIGTTTSVTIAAPIEEVWTAITTSDRIREWFFGVETRGDWVPGGELVQTGEWQGRPYESKAVIERMERPTLLEILHWSPMSGRPDLPENYETVVWRLAKDEDGTRLTVSETNLVSEQARDLSERIWATVLDNLKRLLET
jgi:uncharacterized protein YndB with AHSA1/START domain